jgi:thiamine biosynthesis lipoprotein
MKGRQFFHTAVTVVVLSAGFASAPRVGAQDTSPAPDLKSNAGVVEQRRWVMGTQLRILVIGGGNGVGEAIDRAFDEARSWDALLSRYNPESPLSRVNARAGDMVEVPEELYHYLKRAMNDCRRTDGVFDITVGSLLRAYDGTDPSPAEIIEALENSGHGQLAILEEGGRYFAGLRRPGASLDSGGDGKGVAVDAVMRILRQADIEAALIDFGGSTFFGLGAPAGEEGWLIAVTGIDGEVLGTVRLKDRALSVSATLRVDAAVGGTPEGHVVDPRNGALVTSQRTSVVVSPSAVDAEVLSTSLLIAPRSNKSFTDRFAGAATAVLEAGGGWMMSGGMPDVFDPIDRGSH